MTDQKQKGLSNVMADQMGEDVTPWWIKFFIQVGFPAATAVLLLGSLLGWIPSPLMKKLESMEYVQWQSLSIMRQMCNSITAQHERYKCEPWKPARDD